MNFDVGGGGGGGEKQQQQQQLVVVIVGCGYDCESFVTQHDEDENEQPPEGND